MIKNKLGSYHVYPEGPVLEGDINKVEGRGDGAEDEVGDRQVGNQHISRGEQDLEQW